MRLMQDRVLGETVRKFFAFFKQRDFNAKCVDVFFFSSSFSMLDIKSKVGAFEKLVSHDKEWGQIGGPLKSNVSYCFFSKIDKETS